MFSKKNSSGDRKTIRMIPYSLIGFDEFIQELIKRSTNVRLIAPSLLKYIETGKTQKIDNANLNDLWTE